MTSETTKLYIWVASNSFGIYLFHAMTIYWLEFMATSIPVNPFILSSCVFVFSTALSVLLTITVRRLGLGIIVGEKLK